MTATLDSVANILKEYYDDTDVESMLLEDSPTLALLPKRTDYKGSVMPLPFMYAPTGGVSPNFSAAQASKSDALEEKWDITTNDLFSLFSLDHKAVKAASGNAAAFVDLVESRADAAMSAYKILLNKYIFGNGGGSLGTIEGRTATTITLTERSAMHALNINSQIQPATTDGTSGAVINDIQVIRAINRQTRTITVDAADATNYVAGNQIFIRGGFGNVLRGLGAWNPLATPAATAFFGVNRTIDSRMYATIRTTTMLGDDANVEEALISLSADVADAGGMPNVAIMNTRALRVLVKQLGNKATYERVGATRSDGSNDAKIGFQAVKIIGETGEIKIVGDRNCPYGRVHMLTTKGCGLISMGPLMGFLTYEDDDSKFLRHTSENAMEARIGGYMQYFERTPGFCGTMDMGASGLTLLGTEN